MQQRLFKRGFFQHEIEIKKEQKLYPNTTNSEAWEIIKKPRNGFERFAYKYITKTYVVPRKPFVLSEVIKEACKLWREMNDNTKYYYSNI